MSKTRRSAFSWLYALCLSTLLVSTASAQTITATLNGTVTDEAGAVVLNAKVTVTANSTGQAKTVTTDSEGRYSAPFLQPGGYSVTVEALGFAKSVRSGLMLLVALKSAWSRRRPAWRSRSCTAAPGRSARSPRR